MIASDLARMLLDHPSAEVEIQIVTDRNSEGITLMAAYPDEVKFELNGRRIICQVTGDQR